MALTEGRAAAAEGLRIVGVDAARCVFPLDAPLRFGAVTYASRDYVAVRIRTDRGLCGHGLALGRGTPLFEAIRPAASLAVGTDPIAALAAVRRLRETGVAGWAALVRGHSLVDLALWDLISKAAGLPLHELLGGGVRERIPVLATGGYLIDVRGEDAAVADLVGFREQGYRDLKLMLGGRDAAWTYELVCRCLEAVGPDARLALDFHFSFADLEAAARVCEPLDELGLAFIEDPLPPLHWRPLRELSERLRTPLAAGEDVPDRVGFQDTLEGARILRVDATTCGGLEDAIFGIELAAGAGRPVLPHGPPWLTAQLGAVHEAIRAVEIVPPTHDNGDRVGELFAGSALAFAGAEALVGSQPGLDMELDWARVAELADSTWSV